MGSRLQQGALAVALAMVLVASALLLTPTAAPSSAGPRSTPSSAESQEATEVERGISSLSLSHVPVAKREAAQAFLNELSPAQKVELEYMGATHSSVGASILQSGCGPGNSCATLACGIFGIGCNLNWGSIGESAVGGCIGGAAIGFILAGLPAAPGCVIGAASAVLGDVFGQETANSQVQISHEEQMMALLTQDTLNQLNETSAFEYNALSELNATLYFMETAADSAAVTQLNNTSFNPGLDIAQSPLGYYVNSVLAPFEVTLSKIVQTDQAWLYANYGPNAQYSSSGSYYQENLTGGTCNGGGLGSCPSNSAYDFQGEITAEVPANAYVYVARGASFFIDSGCQWVSVDGANPTLGGASATGVTNYTGQSDVFKVVGGSCVSGYSGGYGIAPVSGWPTSGGGVMLTEMATAFNNPEAAGSASSTQWPGSVAGASILSLCTGGSCGSPAHLPFGKIDEFNTWSKGPSLVQSMLVQAELSAQVYWSYLRSLGYTNVNSIPANCAIPMPAFSLPPEIADGLQGASFATLMGVYDAWLNGLANFFDTPPNTTSFCNGHPIYSGPGGAVYGYDVNMTGYIYVPGKVWTGTTFAAGSPQLSNRSKWSLNSSSAPLDQKGAQPVVMTGWPTEASVSIPVGSVYEIPSNDPLVIIPVQFYAFLTLRGNGSNVQVGPTANLFPTQANLTPGDALYITTCEVNGTFYPSSCPLTFATIQTVFPNVTCGTGSLGACQPTSNGAGAFSGLNFCSWFLISTLCSLFGAGLVNGIVSFVLIIIILVVVAWVVVSVVGRRRGGTQTVNLLTGGR